VTKFKTTFIMFWTAYGSPFCVIIYASYKPSSMVLFMAHPVLQAS